MDEIEVTNQQVIKIESGEYRNAKLKGYFLLADEEKRYESKNAGSARISGLLPLVWLPTEERCIPK